MRRHPAHLIPALICGLLLTGTPSLAQESAPAPTNAALEKEVSRLGAQLTATIQAVQALQKQQAAPKEADAQRAKQALETARNDCRSIGQKLKGTDIHRQGATVTLITRCEP